jgi:hypothetical protein
MKIVQTFWSGNHQNILDNTYGWHAPDYHLAAWALSCLTLRQFYDEVELYTDQKGAKMLIDQLQLPYTKVHIELDQLNDLPSGLWAMSKIHTYAQQTSPFLHVDGDVFIWEAFDQELLKGDLIAQNKEIGTEHFYADMFREVKTNLPFIPEVVAQAEQKNTKIYAYNAGIFGGNNVAFFKSYTDTCFNFIAQNKAHIAPVPKGHLNVFFEQHFFYCLAQQQGLEVSTLFNEIIPDNAYASMGDFHLTPLLKQYLHLIGPFKRDYKSCEKMLQILRRDYPTYYDKITALFPTKYAAEIGLGQSLQTPQKQVDKSNFSYDKTQAIYQALKGNTAPSDNLANEIIKLNDVCLNDVYQYEQAAETLIKKYAQPEQQQALLKRDLAQQAYYQLFQQSFEAMGQTVIVADPLASSVMTQWVWTGSPEYVTANLQEPPQEYHTLLVPTLRPEGYRELMVDDLDFLIIETIKKPLSIFQMLENIKEYFDADDLEDSLESFHQLILGRLENLMFHQCIAIK